MVRFEARNLAKREYLRDDSSQEAGSRSNAVHLEADTLQLAELSVRRYPTAVADVHCRAKCVRKVQRTGCNPCLEEPRPSANCYGSDSSRSADARNGRKRRPEGRRARIPKELTKLFLNGNNYVMDLWSSQDAARRLGLSPRRVRALAGAGRLKAYKVGSRWILEPVSAAR